MYCIALAATVVWYPMEPGCCPAGPALLPFPVATTAGADNWYATASTVVSDALLIASDEDLQL